MIFKEYVFLKHFSCRSLSVWNVHKKRPLVTIRNAHKVTVDDSQVDGTSCKESWVTAVAAVKNCDLVASGNCCKYRIDKILATTGHSLALQRCIPPICISLLLLLS